MTLPAGFESLCRTLDAGELTYRRPAADEPVLFIAFQRPNGRIDGLVQWHPGDVVEWSFAWPFLVRPERRVPAMEAIVALNVGLHVGRFDYDVPTQRIVFRMFHVASGQEMSAQQVAFFVSSGLFAFDNLYLPLQDVCVRDGDPAGPERELRRVIEGALAARRTT